MKKILKDKNNSLCFTVFCFFDFSRDKNPWKKLRLLYRKRDNCESQFTSCSSKENNLLILRI